MVKVAVASICHCASSKCSTEINDDYSTAPDRVRAVPLARLPPVVYGMTVNPRGLRELACKHSISNV
jgi:hypothetical protein